MRQWAKVAGARAWPRRSATLILLSLSAAVAAPTSLVGADPDIDRFEGRWWLYTTGGHVFSSDDGRSWTAAGDGGRVFSLDRAAWVVDDGGPTYRLWAPDMVAANGRYYYYYSVGPQTPGHPSRIGVAVCATPSGGCIDSGRPLVVGDRAFEAIDPAVFVDPRSSVAYIYAGGSAGRDASRLRVYTLAPDMVTVTGRARSGRDREIAQPPHFTEGAFMAYRPENRTYYLSYSHGDWSRSSYEVRYVTAPTPLGPWRVPANPVIVRSDPDGVLNAFKGPGHHGLTPDPVNAGGWIMAYHRWEGQRGDGPYTGRGSLRRVALARIAVGADGAIQPVDMHAGAPATVTATPAPAP